MLTTFQVGDVQNQFHPLSLKHEYDLLEFLQVSKYQHGARLVTVASPSSGKFGAVSVDSMREHLENERFLKDNILLAVVDGLHPRSCIQNLTISGHLSTEWAPHPIRMAVIRVPESEVFTDHERINLSNSASMFSGLVLQTISVTAFIKSLSQYSKVSLSQATRSLSSRLV